MRELAERGSIVLGGCVVGKARWHCYSCNYEWPEEEGDR
jgi:transposase-like protein